MLHAYSLHPPGRRSTLAARLALVVALACLVSLVTVLPTTARADVVGPMGAPSPVYRYSDPTGTHWVSLPQHGVLPDPADFTGWQQAANPSFYVDMVGNTANGMAAVYRWQNPATGGWRDVVQGSAAEADVRAAGFTNQTFQWYAFSTYWPQSVAVYQWFQPADDEWITLADQEIPDATMQGWGYTNKTFLFWAFPKIGGPGSGYFPLSAPQTGVVSPLVWNGATVYPHTFSVLDVNPEHVSAINHGYRYLGYFGTTSCNGIGVARSNDLNASSWQEDPDPLLKQGDRWASAYLETTSSGSRIDVVDNVDYCAADYGIYARTSQDGANGEAFTDPTPLVKESDHSNGNPTLFVDPRTKVFYLYWWRYDPATLTYEIRVKDATTFEGLAADPTDIGQVVVSSRQRIAAPQVFSANGLYYLAIETYEVSDIWKTRVLAGGTPFTFYEIPGNPVYGDGSACVFQQVFDNELHSFYCHQGTPGLDTSWTLDHVSAPLTPV